MLDKNKVMTMLKENNYNGIINHFEFEYSKLLKDFLISKNIEVLEDDKIIDFMYKVRINFPKYSTLMLNLSRKLYDEELSSMDRINKMIDMYKVLIEKFT